MSDAVASTGPGQPALIIAPTVNACLAAAEAALLWSCLAARRSLLLKQAASCGDLHVPDFKSRGLEHMSALFDCLLVDLHPFRRRVKSQTEHFLLLRFKSLPTTGQQSFVSSPIKKAQAETDTASSQMKSCT